MNGSPVPPSKHLTSILTGLFAPGVAVHKALFHLYPDSKFAGAPESIFYGIFTQV